MKSEVEKKALGKNVACAVVSGGLLPFLWVSFFLDFPYEQGGANPYMVIGTLVISIVATGFFVFNSLAAIFNGLWVTAAALAEELKKKE